MKKNYVLLLIAALCVTLTACKKDGVYNPKEKISRIFYQSSYSDGKNLDESWTWDKNLLSKIVYSGGDFKNFEYDGKQLKTVRSSSGSKWEYTYDGAKLKKRNITIAQINLVHHILLNMMEIKYQKLHTQNMITMITRTLPKISRDWM